MNAQVRICPVCGGQFFQTRSGGRPQVYCSRKCRRHQLDRNRRNRPDVLYCTICGKEMPPATGNRPRVYCGQGCRTEGWRRRHAVVEIVCDWCGKTVRRAPTGVAHAERNHFCSQACKGKWMSEHWRGPAHPRWLDETSFIDTIRRRIATDRRWLAWAETVKANAKGICDRCGMQGDEAHHIREVADLIALIIDPTNGEWLCTTCHKGHHRMAHATPPPP